MLNNRWIVLFGITGALAVSCSDDDDAEWCSNCASGGTSQGQGGKAATGGGVGGTGVQAGSPGVGGVPVGGSSAGGALEGGRATQGGVPGEGGAPLATGGTAAGSSGAGGAAVGSSGAGGASAGAGGEAGGPSRDTCVYPAITELFKAQLPPGFCAWEWARNVPDPRGITVDAAGNVLVVSRAGASVFALWDDNGDGVSSPSERATLVTATGLNHGIALSGGYVYASRDRAVYRWPYAADRAALGATLALINLIPTGGHTTRSLALDSQYLYVAVGSAANVDATSERARIRRFALSSLGGAAVPFSSGEVFADGLRNEVGITFDDRGRLWGVENGRDNLIRADLGGDIHADNPGEELNLFAQPGRFYGYPYCWSEFLLPSGVGLGAGTQWADPATIADGVHSDAWCKNTTNVVPPVLSMQAHSAPLDILFYRGTAFPDQYRGDAFVTFHGSWNRTEPTGYKVMHIDFGSNGLPSGPPTPLLEYAGTGDVALEWPYRPVALATLPNGVLLVTSDTSNTILAIGYRAP